MATTSFEPSAKQRRLFAKTGVAMPDGSFYIRPGHPEDLDNAIRAVGRGEQNGGNGNDIRRFIMKRAAALKMTSKIPDTWNPDGSLKQPVAQHDDSDAVGDFFEHHGIKGMHWGVRKAESHPASEDSTRAGELHTRVKRGGTKTLSNEELQSLVTRMNLEKQYKNLSEKNKSAGKKFVDDLFDEAKGEGEKQAKAFVSKQSAKIGVAVGTAVATQIARQTIKGKHAA